MDNSVEDDFKAMANKSAEAGASAAGAMADGVERAVDAGQEVAQQGADAMVDGARRIETETDRMADRTADAMSANAGFNKTVADGLQFVAAEWISSTRALAERTVERMTAIAQARNVVDLIGAQRELFVGGVQDILAAQQRLGSASIDAMTGAAKRATKVATPLAA